MIDLSEGWACPRCGGTLEQSGSQLLCREHEKVGQAGEGFPSFVAAPRYWGELPQEEMVAWCERVEGGGWEAAAEELARQHPELHQAATDRVRGNWLNVYPGPAGGAAADVGAGWGQISACLASCFSPVYALDSVPERARLLAARFAREEKVKVAAAAFPEAPLARGSLSLVVMNGVLEWLAVGSPERSPSQVQLACLRRAHELLAPGGWLYVGIENRFGYHLVLGARDHSGRPYTSLLPRWLASRMVRGQGGDYRTDQEGYRTYTYSYWGYRRLLARAGFARTVVYAPVSGYNRPEAMVPLARVEPLDEYLGTFAAPSRRAALARGIPWGPLRLAMARLWSAYFGIFAQKGEG